MTKLASWLRDEFLEEGETPLGALVDALCCLFIIGAITFLLLIAMAAL
jgi:hypothetical protein